MLTLNRGFELRNAATPNSVELWIYDDIGPEWAGMIGAKTIADALKPHANAATVYVRINSQGGSIIQGTGIYNVLARHPARKIVDIDGLAASIASLIAMAGDEIRMAENALLMIHDPWAAAVGDAEELRLTADVLDKSKANAVKTYAARTGLDPDEIVRMMTAETWLEAHEAKAKGFIDSITPAKQLAASADLSRFKNLSTSATVRLKNSPLRKVDESNDAGGMSDDRLCELMAQSRFGTDEERRRAAEIANDLGDMSAARRAELLGSSSLGRTTLDHERRASH